MAASPAPPAPPAAVAPPRSRLATVLGLLQPLALVLAVALVVVAAAAAMLRWLLVTEAGSRWLLDHAPAVEAEGFRGALLGDRWHADRVRIAWAGGQASLTLEDLRADGLRWHWRPRPEAWLGVDVESVAARRVTLLTGPPGDRPQALPMDLAWPVHLTVATASAGELQIDELAPLRALQLQELVLDAQPGVEHRVAHASADWQGTAIAASARIGNQSPLPLALDATLAPAGSGDAPPWAAVLRASGSAEEVEVAATLRGLPRAGHAAPALDLHARLQPLRRWPLAGLNLRTTALDLAALSPQAPQTRLSGSAVITTSALDAPLRAAVELENALPGRWNEGRLPVRRLTVDALGTLAQRDRLQITRFDVALADAGAPAGRWSGSALWLGDRLTLDTRVEALSPQRLDGRAAAMILTGPLAATLRGLPAPGAPATAAGLQLDWQLDLEGRIDGAPKPVRLALDGSAGSQQLEIRHARAEAGAASAEMRAMLQRAGGGEWQLSTTGSLVDFDPLPWWPGDAGTAWRRGPHRLSADWDLALRMPADAARLPLPALAQRLAGNGRVQARDSVLAGVPLAVDATLAYVPAAVPAPATLHAELVLGGNRIEIDARGDPTGSGAGDRIVAELAAGDVATLAPLARLLPALAGFVPQRGSAAATITAAGRWPGLRSEGSIRVQQLQAGRLALARGDAGWRMETDGAQRLSMQLDLAGARLDGLQADRLRGDIGGTLAEHTIDIAGALPLAPPAMAEQLLGIRLQSGTRLQLLAQGGWRPDPAGGGRWRARVERLQVGAADGSADGGGQAGPAWAEASDLRAELSFGSGGTFDALRADPGRLRLGEMLSMRWDEVHVDLRPALPRIELHADIESFALAPLLARLQPGVGWQGDLMLAARIDIRAAERFDADLVVERRDGDLHIADSSSTQLLGLTELRLALSAHDGLWIFTPVLKGRSLGQIGGQWQVRTSPERRWPAPDAVLGGSAQAQVADLGIWSAWVPPGWRLGGELSGTATLSGLFGDPRYTGSIGGSRITVRNLLEGVSVTDGEVRLALDGDSARIERFTLRGGDGTLALGGSATLGRSPQARVEVVADRFRVLGRVDRMAIASGRAELSLQAEQARLDGRFTIDEGRFDISRADAPSLDDDVTLRHGDRADDEAAAQTAAPRPQRFLVLGIDLDLGGDLHLRGRGLDTQLHGLLRLSNPGGRLDITGTINTASGTYAAYGQKLEIERGIVAFSGVADNPRLDVLAVRPDIDARVGVAIAGNLLTPRVRLFAEPELSDNEKLSWLVLGRPPDGLGRTDTALLQRAAVALLAGEGEAPTDALLRNLGIDEISLRQSEGDVSETVISLGKQLSRRWYVGYERGVNATTGTWQLIYRIAQRFTLRAQSGLDNSLDVIWVWRVQETPEDAGMRKSVVVPP